MKAQVPEKAKEIGVGAVSLLRRWTMNAGRRLLIVLRWVAALWQQRRLNRAWRRLGREVHLALDAGEINPMLTETVRDAVLRARDLKAAKDRHLEIIAALRAKIRESKGAPPPVEVSPADLDKAARGE